MPKKQKKLSKPLNRLYNSITISNLWLSVLSLANEQPIYAYTLPVAIEKKFGFCPSRLLVYLVLYKLETGKYLTSREENKRKYYSITLEGQTLLEDARKLLKARAKEI